MKKELGRTSRQQEAYERAVASLRAESARREAAVRAEAQREQPRRDGAKARRLPPYPPPLTTHVLRHASDAPLGAVQHVRHAASGRARPSSPTPPF